MFKCAPVDFVDATLEKELELFRRGFEIDEIGIQLDFGELVSMNGETTKDLRTRYSMRGRGRKSAVL